MDTKEAIVRIKKVYKFIDDDEKWRNIGNKIKEFNREERDKIIELLKRGENFENMWSGLYVEIERGSPDFCKEFYDYMEKLEQKYFPKEK